MKTSRFSFGVSLVAGLAALTTLYLGTRVADRDDYHRVVRRVDDLRLRDRRLSIDVLRARHGRLGHYDTITNDARTLAELADLRDLDLDDWRRDTPGSQVILAGVSDAFHLKTEAIESFKTANSVLHTSTRYFPTAVRQLLDDLVMLEGTGPVRAELRILAEETFSYAVNGDIALGSRIETNIVRLLARTDLTPPMRARLVVVAAQARNVVRRGAEAEETVGAVLSLPTDASIDAFHRSYDAYYARNAARARVYRALLYAAAVALLCWVVVAVVRIRRTNGELEGSLARMRTLQGQLVAADHMAAIGRLSASVAHEINNPLAYVLGNVKFLGTQLKRLKTEPSRVEFEDLEAAVDDAQEGADRVRAIVQGLKAFARADEPNSEAVELERVLEASIKMAMPELKHRTRVITEFGPVPPVAGGMTRLGQVFLNLLVNAGQAIRPGNPDGNVIRVTTRTDDAGRAVVEVSDTGSGIPPEIRGRLFEPFFTTKPLGEGTGLGLSICHGIVAALSGEIGVTSEVGVGSTFRVSLPPAATTPDASPKPSAEPAAAARRRGRILVVDDEPRVGTMIQRILGEDHDVVATTCGIEALARITTGERYDVILCDLIMPGMTGMDFHRELARDRPRQAREVIFMTGGACSEEGRRFVEACQDRCLDKPLREEVLRAAVTERLG